jgi:hypothetical protein
LFTESVSKSIFEKNAARVLERPAPKELLDYAAADIRMLAHLARILSARGIVKNLKELTALSARHVSRNGITARRRENDVHMYPVGWLLLLDALTAPPGMCQLVCKTCGARLPLEAFERQKSARREQCRLCVVGPMVKPALTTGNKNKNTLRLTMMAANAVPKTWVGVT